MNIGLAERVFISCVLSLGLCVGQAPQNWRTPKADDPELYYTFFYLYQDLFKWSEARGAVDKVKGEAILRDVRAKFHLSEFERVRLKDVCNEITNRLAANREAAAGYRRERESAGLVVDQAVLREFAIKRMSIIEDGASQIRLSLSGEAWKGVTEFVNGQHRASLKKMDH